MTKSRFQKIEINLHFNFTYLEEINFQINLYIYLFPIKLQVKFHDQIFMINAIPFYDDIIQVLNEKNITHRVERRISHSRRSLVIQSEMRETITNLFIREIRRKQVRIKVSLMSTDELDVQLSVTFYAFSARAQQDFFTFLRTSHSSPLNSCSFLCYTIFYTGLIYRFELRSRVPIFFRQIRQLRATNKGINQYSIRFCLFSLVVLEMSIFLYPFISKNEV